MKKYVCFAGVFGDYQDIIDDNENGKVIEPFFETNNFRKAKSFVWNNTNFYYDEKAATIFQMPYGCVAASYRLD